MMSDSNLGVMNTIDKYVRPIGETLANQRHLSAISAGMMSVVGVSMIGSFSQILSAIVSMFTETGVLGRFLGISSDWVSTAVEILSVPFTMTTGLISLLVAFGVAFQLGKSYKLNQMQVGVVSLIMFLMVVSPAKTVTLADGVTTFTGLDTTFLGSTGMFTAIVIALGSVEIFNLCQKYNWVIKMPDSMPPALQSTFNAVVPLLINAVVFYGINVILSSISTDLNIATATAAIFMAPVSHFVGSVPGMLIINIFAVLLWLIGVHGTMITLPFVLPVLITTITSNGALVAQGLPPEFDPSLLFLATSAFGGTGGTIGLVLLCAFHAKSEQLRAVGKISLIPGFFNINEPLFFGLPIVLNPLLAIPYILVTLVLTLLLWGAYEIGFLIPLNVLFLSTVPYGVGEFIGSLSWTNALFPFLMIPVTALIYYPFFRIYDKQLLQKETELKDAE